MVQIWAAKFFFKTLVSSVNRYHGQLSSCTIPEKTNDPILKKLRDGQTGIYRRTDRGTDPQADKSEFIGHCPSNIEHPKSK